MGLGTFLIKLPASTYGGISWVDALFVSVSAASVTGLSSVDYPATFTHFDSIVVMIPIQVGRLGIMTLTTLAALLVDPGALGPATGEGLRLSTRRHSNRMKTRYVVKWVSARP
jgi:Trk-type K+ transport system membrane component